MEFHNNRQMVGVVWRELGQFELGLDVALVLENGWQSARHDPKLPCNITLLASRFDCFDDLHLGSDRKSFPLGFNRGHDTCEYDDRMWCLPWFPSPLYAICTRPFPLPISKDVTPESSMLPPNLWCSRKTETTDIHKGYCVKPSSATNPLFTACIETTSGRMSVTMSRINNEHKTHVHVGYKVNFIGTAQKHENCSL